MAMNGEFCNLFSSNVVHIDGAKHNGPGALSHWLGTKVEVEQEEKDGGEDLEETVESALDLVRLEEHESRGDKEGWELGAVFAAHGGVEEFMRSQSTYLPRGVTMQWSGATGTLPMRWPSSQQQGAKQHRGLGIWRV
jgi:hypothetical protein